MKKLEKMGRQYTAMLKTICGSDYEKVQAASQAALRENEHFYDPVFVGTPEMESASKTDH